jgi:trypsin
MHKVKRIIQHPNFSFSTIDFDYSIMELEEPIEFDETKQPIKLPSQDQKFEDNRDTFTCGFGNTQNINESRNQLRYVSVPIFNQAKCSKAYEEIDALVTSRMICAGFEKGQKDACQGWKLKLF